MAVNVGKKREKGRGFVRIAGERGQKSSRTWMGVFLHLLADILHGASSSFHTATCSCS